jgi:hypothetical protein
VLSLGQSLNLDQYVVHAALSLFGAHWSRTFATEERRIAERGRLAGDRRSLVADVRDGRTPDRGVGER